MRLRCAPLVTFVQGKLLVGTRISQEENQQNYSASGWRFKGINTSNFSYSVDGINAMFSKRKYFVLPDFSGSWWWQSRLKSPKKCKISQKRARLFWIYQKIERFHLRGGGVFFKQTEIPKLLTSWPRLEELFLSVARGEFHLLHSIGVQVPSIIMQTK